MNLLHKEDRFKVTQIFSNTYKRATVTPLTLTKLKSITVCLFFKLWGTIAQLLNLTSVILNLVRVNRLLLPFQCKTSLLNSNRKSVSLYCYNNPRRVGKLDVELAEDASALRPEPTFDTSQTFSCTSYMLVNQLCLFCKITFDIESHITLGQGIKSYDCSSHKSRYPGCYMKYYEKT